MALSRINRLKDQKTFKRLFTSKKSVNGIFLFLKIQQNELDISRFGLSISVKVIPKAVDRNKIKRKLSESIKTILPKIKAGYDIGAVIKKEAGIDILTDELIHLIERSNLISNS